MHTHTYAHENTCACMTPSTRWSTDTETHNLCTISIHIHIHMCINAYIYTCTYIYIHMSAHIHAYTYIHTYKMYICTHASTPGTTAKHETREELMQTQEALHFSFVRRNQTTFSTSNARTSLSSWDTNTPQPLIPSSQHTPEQFAKMAPCVVVEWLGRKQWCSRAPVSEHAEHQAREWPKWPFTEKRRVNEKQPNPQCLITQSRQRSAQTTSIHLHWCGADPHSSWPAHVTCNKGNPLNWGYIFTIFAGSRNEVTFSPFSRQSCQQHQTLAGMEFCL